MKTLIVVCILLIADFKLSECIDCSTDPKNTEVRLKQKILCSYDKDERPVSDSKNGTVVTIRMFIKSFDYMDYSGTMEINSWLGMKWIDNHLKWEPNDYDGITSITIHSDEIWMPDFAIYNSENTQFHESCTSSHCVLRNNGAVSCAPPCSHSGKCHGQHYDWPFDVQNCSLYFGSWMHKGSEILYKLEKLRIDDEAMTGNNEWKIIGLSYKNIPGNYSCCPNETYPSVKVNIVVERSSAAEKTFVIVPIIILSILNLTALWLSPICTERILLNIFSLYGHFTLQQQLSWITPKNGDNVPKALTFCRDSMVISTVLILHTVFLRGILSHTSSVPNWMKSTTDSLRSNKIGQLMFTNPYLINRGTPLNNEDASNLVEEQPTETSNQNQQKVSEDEAFNIRIKAARMIDSLMFLCLVITYLILMFGWLPISHNNSANAINAEIIGIDDD